MKKFLIAAIAVNAVLLAFIIWMLVEAKGEYVTAPSGLRIRSEPSTESEIVTVLPFGEQVFGEIEAGWMRLEDGRGYVSADWISAEDPCDGMQYLGSWRVTSYAWSGFRTASGEWPEVGRTVAANGLELGTEIYISGIGHRWVLDRGPSSLGNQWLDLYLGDTQSCIQFGDQYRDVYLVSTP